MSKNPLDAYGFPDGTLRGFFLELAEQFSHAQDELGFALLAMKVKPLIEDLSSVGSTKRGLDDTRDMLQGALAAIEKTAGRLALFRRGIQEAKTHKGKFFRDVERALKENTPGLLHDLSTILSACVSRLVVAAGRPWAEQIANAPRLPTHVYGKPIRKQWMRVWNHLQAHSDDSVRMIQKVVGGGRETGTGIPAAIEFFKEQEMLKLEPGGRRTIPKKWRGKPYPI